jgi:D-alanyl-D-alanine carboxypeptidase
MKSNSLVLIIFGLLSIILLISGVVFLPDITSKYPGHRIFSLKSNKPDSEIKVPEQENNDKSDLEDRITSEQQPNSQSGEGNTTTPTPDSSGNWWDYPAQIVPVTKDPNDLTVLVNKKYKLPESYAPNDLVLASNSGIRTTGSIYLRNTVIADLNRLANDSAAAGVEISVISGYRSYSNQLSTYQYWVNYNGGNSAMADQISARAGHSQHQLGTALDLSTSEINDQIGAVFNNTAAANWLNNNAANYGFVMSYPAGAESVTGYQHESWHYRYIGVENALAFKGSGMILDQWLSNR